MNIYYWQVNGHWCYNGSVVTSLTPPWENAYIYGGAAAAWNYDGVVSSTGYMSGTSIGVVYSQGHFDYTPPPYLYTLFNGWPDVRLNLHGNGTYSVSGSSS